MLLKQMMYLAAVVECNSFTEAAEQCYISQSAISQQIRALEKELGVELIHRENRKFHVTAAGEYFYRHSREILSDIERLQKETTRIGQDDEQRLRIGYLNYYSGQELQQAIAEFAKTYPEVHIDVVNGTHEELYDLLRFGEADLVLNDQRRAFSDEYVNCKLLECKGYVEISVHNRLSSLERITFADLKHSTCILISSKEQQKEERDYYQKTLGFGGNFLFVDNLEESRLMVIGNRGFMPIESIGTMPATNESVKRVPLYRGDTRLKRNFCAFWRKEGSNYYIEEFVGILCNFLQSTK